MTPMKIEDLSDRSERTLTPLANPRAARRSAKVEP
jgi:hypothetical protein